MDNANHSRVFDTETINFLESVSDKAHGKSVDLGILSSAGSLNIDLNALESLDGTPKLKSIKQSRKADRDDEEEIAVQDFIEEADIHLKDIINKVFRNSERSFVIVRDDKIEYANKTFLKVLGVAGESDVLKKNFLKFVVKEDWNLLAENIGEMLTNDKNLMVRLRLADNKVQRMNFEAVYLPDNQHFTFILIGSRIMTKANLVSGLYDDLTGLPNFYLLEDRVQMAVNAENYKDIRQKKNMIALAGISIDNMKVFKNMGIDDLILRKLSERLVLSLRKTFTVASGLKYQFWVLIPNVDNMENLDVEIKRIKAAFDEPVADNFTEHHLDASIGVSIFPSRQLRPKTYRAGYSFHPEGPARRGQTHRRFRSLRFQRFFQRKAEAQYFVRGWRVTAVGIMHGQAGADDGGSLGIFASRDNNPFGVLTGFGKQRNNAYGSHSAMQAGQNFGYGFGAVNHIKTPLRTKHFQTKAYPGRKAEVFAVVGKGLAGVR